MFEFQDAGIEFLRSRPRALLADEPGGMSLDTINLVPCRGCGRKKTMRRPRNGGRNRWICLPCEAEQARQWRFNNREKSRAGVRRWRLLHKYGLTPEQYDDLAAKQQNKCAICGDPPSQTNQNHARLKVDHDHRTGQVRGLLCNRCNLLLGFYESKKSAIQEYLDSHSV